MSPRRLRKPIRLRFALPPVLLRGPRNPSVSSAAPGATFGVSLRGLRSPLAPSLSSGAAGLLRRLGKPALPGANALAALVFPRCFGSHLWCLPPPPRQPCGLSRVFFLSFPYPPARARAPAGIRDPFELAPICHSRESGNPGYPVCLPLSFPQCGFAFNVYSSRAVSFRRSRIAATRNLFAD